jgi:hypothetical protein
LYLTIGAIIVAALLIVAGVIVFATRGRGTIQAPPVQPPTSRDDVQPSEPGTAHRTEQHRRKTTTSSEASESTA